MRGGLLLLPVALVLLLGVLLLNRGPLFYVDTGGYVSIGVPLVDRILGPVSLPRVDAALREVPATPDTSPAGDLGNAAGDDGARTVGGTHSKIYSLLVALFLRMEALSAVPLINATSLLVAVWLPARVVARDRGVPQLTARLVAIPVIAAAAGALPFYVAYMMPDIFAPILIIVIATLTVFGRRMTRGEILTAAALGIFAVVVHLSHLAIALLLLPIPLLAVLLFSRQRWWMPAAMVFAIGAVGILHVKGFEVAAKVVADKEVVYHPLVTARLITNGPGYDYLAGHCPDREIDTCRLWDALSKSDNPWRLSSSHIVFSRHPELGSYRLMSPEDRRLVAAEQQEFFLRVLADRPFATAGSLVGDTLEQVVAFSVDMTIPRPEEIGILGRHPHLASVSMGELTEDRSWIDPLDQVHGGLYAASFLVIVAMLVTGSRRTAGTRGFALMLVLGVLANAFVCGALSQPADRYGARVIWLLPFAAAFLVVGSGVRLPSARGADGVQQKR